MSFFIRRAPSTFSLSLSLSSQPRPLLPPAQTRLLQLTLVGKILDASEHASSTVLRVDDGTGIVSIKYWGDNDDEGNAGDDNAAARRAAWQPGAYIRVHGNLRAFDGARSLVAFNVRPVSDHNEISYHLAQCMLQHAHLAKTSGSGGNATAIAATAGGAAAAAAVAAAKPEAAGGDPNAVGADGLTGAQREAKAQVATLGGGPQGASVDDVVAALQGRGFAEVLVRDAVAFLLEEGHLYSTVDENHVKVA